MLEPSPFSVPVNDRFDAVIAGSGYAGLAFAAAAARGLGPKSRLAIISREDVSAHTSRPDSRAVTLSAASVRMLDTLGVWNLCRDAAEPVTAIDISDSSLEAGVRPILLSYDNALGTGEPASHVVPAQALESALATTILQLPNLTRITGATVSAFKADISEISITVSSGQTLNSRLLVAADGSRSPLRTMAGITTVGRPYTQTGITVTVRHETPHHGRAIQHFLPSGPFAMLPLPGNRSCITWSEDTKTAGRLLALDDAAFIAELELRAGGRLGALTLDGPRQSWPLELAIPRALIARRFALIGDAAHSVHPLAGQGLNLGLRDVAALAEVIVDTHRLGLDIGASTTLQRYERWRRSDNAISAAGFDGLNRLFSSDSPPIRSLREAGLGLVHRLPRLKQHLVAEAAGTSGDLPRLLRGEPV